MKLPADIVGRLRGYYADRRVCVTGGAGFIGGHLCDALISLGASVSIIDDLSNSDASHVAELVELDAERLRFVHASILDDAAMREAMEGARTVFHLAALGSVPKSIEQPQRTWSVNATGTVRVLEAARESRCERVVYSASSSAYGDDPAMPKVETAGTRPVSPYAASKLAGEQALYAWSKSFGVSTISLRYFNIFGPRQSADSAYAAVIAAFAKRLLNNESPVIFGDGGHSRDFTFVSNAVLANLLAGASTRALSGEVVNVGTGTRVDLLELARTMGELCGVPHLSPVHEPERAGDVKHSQADLARAREVLGYAPVTGLREGLEETVAWYRELYAGASGRGGA